MFKTGDHSVPGNYRPISLASCCFKVLEHMVSRIAPCISPQLHHCQGGFRWGADMMAGSLIDVLHMRSATHTFVAFVVHGTFSQVRSGADLSEPWQDSSIAQGRVLSPLLFNILVDGLARAVHDAYPGVSLMARWDSRFAGQLYADDLVIVADSAADLQTSLDAVSAWGFRYRFTFGVGGVPRLHVCQAPGALVRVSTCGSNWVHFGSISGPC